ncbi:MAG: hypothetical protein ABIN18_29155 [Pseudomonadota bacterium]
MIKRVGKSYWLDFRIGKKRIRRTLKTDDLELARSRAKVIEEELREKHGLPDHYQLKAEKQFNEIKSELQKINERLDELPGETILWLQKKRAGDMLFDITKGR